MMTASPIPSGRYSIFSSFLPVLLFIFGLTSLPVNLLWLNRWSNELTLLQHVQVVEAGQVVTPTATTSSDQLIPLNLCHAFVAMGILGLLMSLISLILGAGCCWCWGSPVPKPVKYKISREPTAQVVKA